MRRLSRGSAPIQPVDLDLPICTASMALAATSRYVLPRLKRFSAVLFAYLTIPSFKSAYEVLFEERRLGSESSMRSSCSTCLATN